MDLAYKVAEEQKADAIIVVEPNRKTLLLLLQT